MENRKLTMKFAGRFIELLGQQMYGGPVPAVAELIANAWDADASKVEVEVPQDPTAIGAEIVVRDFGHGMSFDELNEYYLTIGYERRARGQRSPGGRLVMGRKGIGKLAGFGIAEDIIVRSVQSGRAVEILLNYADLRNRQAIEGLELEPTADEETTDPDGVTVTFRRLKLRRRINLDSFTLSMSRRFALQSDQMEVVINGTALTKEMLALEHRDPAAPDWAEEEIENLGLVRYWIGFLDATITDPELRGISVFARGRLAQATPNFFNLSGGINGQVGLEYLTGQVEADFLDEDEDCIATDRQSVNWQFEGAKALEAWGQQKIKDACREWKKRRKKEKEDKFRHSYSQFNEKIEGLPPQEKEDVITALDRIADVDSISPEDFNVIAGSLLEGVTRESVKKVIRRINSTDEDALDDLLTVIREWDVVSAVATAEVVAGRIEIIEKFKRHIEARTPEKAPGNRIDMQTFLRDDPWLLGHEYEHLSAADFHHEHGVDKWIEEQLRQVDSEGQFVRSDEREGRRFDLLCIRDDARIVILELMRPGLAADFDHVSRLNRYVTRVRAFINSSDTRPEFRNKSVRGLLIADKIEADPALGDTLNSFSKDLDAVSWEGLFNNVSARYREFLDLLKLKAPNDPRIRGLINVAPPDAP